MDHTFQFSSGCLAESFDGTAREEKFDRINYSWKHVWTVILQRQKGGLEMSLWISIYDNYVIHYYHCYCDFYRRQKGGKIPYYCSVLKKKNSRVLFNLFFYFLGFLFLEKKEDKKRGV